jgi:hypothetical protein
MFSTLRTRFGIPGVISVIALVFAMFGGAYAASNSSGGGKATASAKAKKGPRGPKGATGPAGPAGAQGPAGPAGAKGDAGANGANGAAGPTGPTGAAGAKGATGAAGATGATGAAGQAGFPDTLPSGKTETGYWALVGAGTSGFTGTAIGFPIPLKEGGAEGSAFAFTLTQTQNEEFGTSGCAGSAEKPTAPPGVLCVYTAVDLTSPAITPHLEAKSFQNTEPIFESFGSTGALLEGDLVPPGQNQDTWGTWAVTAP